MVHLFICYKASPHFSHIFHLFYLFLPPHLVYKYMFLSHISLNVLNSIYLSSFDTDHSSFLRIRMFGILTPTIFFPYIPFIFQSFHLCCFPWLKDCIAFQVHRWCWSSFIWLSTPFLILFPSLDSVLCSFWFLFHILDPRFAITFADSSHPCTTGSRILPLLHSERILLSFPSCLFTPSLLWPRSSLHLLWIFAIVFKSVILFSFWTLLCISSTLVIFLKYKYNTFYFPGQNSEEIKNTQSINIKIVFLLPKTHTPSLIMRKTPEKNFSTGKSYNIPG